MTFVPQDMCLKCPANKLLSTSLNDNSLMVPTSIGELYDKISILEIKKENIKNEEKLINVNNELNKLKEIANRFPIDNQLYQTLKNINDMLWKIEDDIREKEKEQCFDEEFIQLARMVYKTNDWRSDVKKEINLKYGSQIIEEKSYEQY